MQEPRSESPVLSAWWRRSVLLVFVGAERIRILEWISMPSHLILIIAGVVPMVLAAGMTYLRVRKT